MENFSAPDAEAICCILVYESREWDHRRTGEYTVKSGYLTICVF